MDETPDGWYRQLSIKFEDGSGALLHIQRKPTGTHIPLLREGPEPWTGIKFHQCPCCPLPDTELHCPAAISLQTTMSKLRSRKSFEKVMATAIDASGRSQTVEWTMQAVGSALVQLAVFASGCPVGRRLKPYLEGLPPFVSSLDLSRSIAKKILNKHGGSIEAARQELAESLAPLHDVFKHLSRRINADEQSRPRAGQGIESLPRDAVPNSISQVDAFAQRLALQSNSLFSQLSVELGWSERPKPAPQPAAQPADKPWWRRLLGLS